MGTPPSLGKAIELAQAHYAKMCRQIYFVHWNVLQATEDYEKGVHIIQYR